MAKTYENYSDVLKSSIAEIVEELEEATTLLEEIDEMDKDGGGVEPSEDAIEVVHAITAAIEKLENVAVSLPGAVQELAVFAKNETET